MASNPHDLLFKAVFSDPEHAGSVLREIVSGPYDWSGLQLTPGSFVDEDLTERHTDLLFRVPTADGNVAIYVLFEHQSMANPDMAVRLLEYITRIHRMQWTHDKQTLPVVPVVLYNGRRRWHPSRHFGTPGLGVSFHYTVIDLSTHSSLEVKGTALARLTQAALREARRGDLFRALASWASLVREVRSASGLEAIEVVLRYVLSVSETGPTREDIRALLQTLGPETTEKMMTWRDQLLAQGRAEGREEGRREGREEARAEARKESRALVLQVLELRFGEVSDLVRARVADASPEDLSAWTARVFTASTAEECVA